MKFLLFAVAVAGVVPLAFVLSRSRQWVGWAVLGMFAGVFWHDATSLNFFSNEFYRGSARGMEIGIIHLLAVVVLLALFFQSRSARWLPDGGIRIYWLYFLLCLPSLATAAVLLYCWLEIWKMLMMALVFVAVYNYLRATDDVETVVGLLAAITLGNALVTLRQHYILGLYQSKGIFPHRNCMGMAMLQLGPVFFSWYLVRGGAGWRGKILVLAFVGAVVSTVMTYSRGSLIFLPVAYGVAGGLCLLWKRTRGWVGRLVPVLLVAAIGAVKAAPTVINRFATASGASANTRIELAWTAWEMIKDEPWRGVGINNWGVKINLPYTYAELGGRFVGDHPMGSDGIVETVYLLVAAECGIPALVGFLAWLGWYGVATLRLAKRLRDTDRFWIPAGLAGGLAAIGAQSTLEWVLRQHANFTLLMICFALLAHLDVSTRRAPAPGTEVAA